MTPDMLDDLLRRSAPATRAEDPGALRAMVAAAREVASARRRRVGISIGVLAVLLIGGAGVATASSDWLWGADMDDPLRSVTYISPTWGACELRLGDLRAANPFDQLAMDRVIDDWFSSTDIETEIIPLIPGYLAVLEGSQAADPDPITDPRLPDLNYWTAVDQAVGELLHDELATHGFSGGSGLASGGSQVHCEGEQWR